MNIRVKKIKNSRNKEKTKWKEFICANCGLVFVAEEETGKRGDSHIRAINEYGHWFCGDICRAEYIVR